MKGAIKQTRQNSRLILEELEPRRLFSGGIEGLIDSSGAQLPYPLYRDLDAQAPQQQATNDEAAVAEQRSHEIVFVDTAVENYQQFVDDLQNRDDSSRDIEVVVLERERDGVEQISVILQQYSDIDAVHIISHGSDASIALGNGNLNADSLRQSGELVAQWAAAFSDTGDILIYGCDLAASELGQGLIDDLAALTGTDVAASNDLTGASALGGDWLLEYSAGKVETSVALSAHLQQEYQHTLATITVSTLDDSGAGSLRQAIADAGSGDRIEFTVTGTINLNSGLPTINKQIDIDATTAPGYAGEPLVILDGSSAGSASGLDFRNNSDGSSVSGLAIVNFSDNGIETSVGADGIVITGNWIGTTGNGSTGTGNGNNGINLRGANTIIGGTGPNDGNVITNNGNEGINVTGNSATGTIIQGNIIGLDPDGSGGSGNGDVGIALLSGADGTLIGGTTPGAGNIIAMNFEGIEISSDNNIVQGNYIGTDITGTLDRGNSPSDGIEVINGANGNLIGGTAAGAGNLIAYNGDKGIEVQSGTDNALLGNIVYGQGGGDVVVNPGANGNQAAPVLASADINTGGQVDISANLTSAPNSFYRVEFFGVDQAYLGFANVATDGTGNATIIATLMVNIAHGDTVSASATESDASFTNFTNSSQLSASINAVRRAPYANDDPGFFSSEIQTLNPVGYWRLGEGAGGAADLGSSGNSGTYNGTTPGEAGAISGDGDLAVRFDGASDYIEITHSDDYLLDEGTVQVWFNVDDPTSGDLQHLFSKDSIGFVTGGHLSLAINTAGQLEARMQDTTTSYTITSAASVSAGQWHHAALSFGSDGMALYLDGALVASDSYSGGMGTSSGGAGNYENIAIGAGTRTSASPDVTPVTQLFTGVIDEVALFGDQLDAETINQLFNAGVNSIEVSEDGAVSVATAQGVLVNDFDEQGDVLSVLEVNGSPAAVGNQITLPSGALLTLNSDGSLDYDPNGQFETLAPGATDTDTFSYTLSDGTGRTDTATVTIVINGSNDAPVITSSAGVNVVENYTSVINVTASDPEMDVSSYSISGGADQGFFNIDSVSGALSFISAPNFEAPADGGANNTYQVEVTADDGNGGTDTQLITVTVTNANDSVNAVDDAFTVDEDSQLNSEGGWFDNSWLYRRTLSFDNSMRSENLLDFPVLITLDSSSIDYTKTHDQGDDLRFFDQDGSALAHEIELWDESGISYVWVRIPQIDASSTTDSIVMYYGNAGVASDGQDAAGLWSAYQAAYHLNEDPGTAGTVVDAAGNYDATNVGSTDSAGIIANAQNFNGVDQYIDLGDDRPWINNSAGASLSLWINADTTSGNNDLIGVSQFEADGTSSSSRITLIRQGDNIRVIARALDDSSDVITVTTSTSPLTAGQWHHVTGTVDYSSDTNNINIYVDGVLQGTFSHDFPSNAVEGTNSTQASLGSNEGGINGYYDGRIDEARISDQVRSADWVAAQYAAMTGNLVNIGFEQTVEGVIANDIDSEGDALSVVQLNAAPGAVGLATLLPSGAIVTLNADGSFIYDTNSAFESLAAGVSTTDSFTYQVADGIGDNDVATVTITINGVNDVPVITPIDVAGSITEGGTVSETGSITFTDLDLTDLPTATEATASVTTALTLTPAQQAVIENAFTITPAVGNSNNGTINWDYTIADTDLDFLAAGETVTVVFTITVDDGNGGSDTQDVTIAITGANDAPVIAIVDVTGNIAEGGTVSESGSITFTDLDLTDLPTATEATASVTTTLTLTPAQQAAIENAFTISPAVGNSNNGTINWDYTIADTDLGFLAAGETVTVVFTITVDDGNGGTDIQDVTIDITGANDAPVIAIVDVTGNIAEGGIVSESGSITFTDLDLTDLPTATEATASVTTTLTLTPAQQAAIENAFTIAPAVGNSNNGTINWDYTIADTDLGFLAAGETVTVVFTITVDDGNGGTDIQDVTINITGSTDAPVITPVDVAGTITEGGTVSETGSITFTDLDLTDLPTATEATASVTTALTLTPAQQAAIENAFTITPAVGNSNNGTIDWDYTIADTDLDFLAAGETVTVVFTITVDDGNGGTDTQDVTINITGSTDAPVITPVDVVGTITEGGTVSETGSITFTDLDLTDLPTATESTASVTTALTLTPAQQAAIENAFTITPAVGNSNNGTINWDYTIADTDLGFLAAGETVTVVFTITVDDGNGGTDIQDVTINITGSTDAPVITPVDVAGTITEGGTVSETGSITFTDLDLTDLPTATEATASVTTALTLTPAQQAAIENAFTIAPAVGNSNNGTIDWDYTIADTDLDFLAAGETVTVVFTITVDDGNGGTDTQDVTIAITGANDAPVIAIVDVTGNITEGGTVSETGSITFTDVDLSDLPTATESTASVTTALTLTPAQQAAIENAFTITPAVGNSNNGTIDWDYTIADTDLDFLAAGETVTVVFTITVDDGNGGTDTQDVTIAITGANDAPVIAIVDVTGNITEGGTVSETGSITFTDVDLSDLPTATEATASVTTALTLTPAQQAAIENAFTITPAVGNSNNGTIDWDYTIADTDLDFLAAGETVTVVFTITVDDGNGGTDTQDVTIAITGANDAPVIAVVDVTGNIAEGGTVSETGSITFTDLDLTDLPTATEATASVTTALTLTPAQQAAIENAFTIAPAVGNSNNGTINWDYTIADTDLGFLAAGETVTVVFTITVDDGNGGTDIQDVTINITGSTDAPVITPVDVAGTITEGGTVSETGSITFTDLDLTDLPTATEATASVTTALTLTPAQQAAIENAFTITPAVGNSNNGTINWDYTIADTDLGFLAAGETVTVVFTITVDDGNGGTDTQDVTIAITGSNDAPVITPVDVVGTITEGGTVSETGSITFTDLDLTDTPTATEATASVTTALTLTPAQQAAIENAFTIAPAVGNSNSGTIDWDYTIADTDLDFLAAGETVTVVFTITVDDGNGGTDTQDVTINITGSTDAPVITPVDVTGTITEGGTVSESGSITFTDLDLADTPTATAATASITTALTLTPAQQAAIENAFTISPAVGNSNNGTIDWDYTIADTDLDFLAAGETVTVVFTITVDDGNGGTDTQDVTINITGSTDAPVITPVDVAGTITEGGTVSESGSITFTDLDLTDSPTATEATASVTTALTLTPAQQAAIENAFTITPAVGNSNNGTINWDYTIADTDLDFLAAGETVTVVFTITVDDGNGGTDTQDVTINITGSTDAPVIIPVDVVGTITEGGTVSESGSITFTDLDLTDLPAATEATASVATALTLTPAQQAAIENAFTIAPAVGNSNNGTIDWDYTIADTDLDFLAAGETITVVFTITVDDGNGGSDTQDVTIDITGANDAPVIAIVDVTGNIAEGGTVSETGSITFTDLDLTDLPTATEATASVTTALTLTPAQQAAIENAFTIAPAIGNSNNGTIDWDYTIADTDLDFLVAGETVTVVFTVTVDDGNGGTDTQDVTIDINGANDAPVIAIVDVTGNITEGGTVSETGSITFTDLDLTDTPTATEATASVTATLALTPAQQAAIENAFTISPAVGNSNNGTINWDYTIADTDLDFLGAGETVTVVFTITVDDGNGGTDTQDVTINIIGNNDAPVIGGVNTGTVVEDVNVSSGNIIASGKLTIIDPDAGESNFVAQTINGFYGTLGINAAGHWSYVADNSSPDIQALYSSQSLVETLTVTTADGSIHTVVININGSNEPDDSSGGDPDDTGYVPPDDEEPPPGTDPTDETAPVVDPGTDLVDPDDEDIYTIAQIRDPQSSPNEIDNYVDSGPGTSLFIDLERLQQIENSSPLNLPGSSQIESSIANLDFDVTDSADLDAQFEQALLQRLELMRNDIDSDSNRHADNIEVQILLGATTTLTAGIVSWVLRAGSLMASLLGAVPLLNRFDPLPILKTRNDEKDVEDDDDTTEITGPVGERHKRVNDMFGNDQTDLHNSRFINEQD